MRLLALADDATGALEVGAQWAGAHGPVPVWLSVEPPDPARFAESDCLVIDTETRTLAPQEAGERLRLFAQPGAARIYKKTDSTLRGNIAAEFGALMQMWPGRPLVYVPAYPDLGRTVVDGELLVDGQPLRETAFARDPLNPVTEGRIPELLRVCDVPVTVVPHPDQLPAALDKGGIVVCDGTRNEDLQAVAQALRVASVNAIAAGPAAFARHWTASEASTYTRPQPKRCLVVNGSCHPASREQVRWAAREGWNVVEWHGRGTIAANLENWTVITTAEQGMGHPADVARELARTVCQALGASSFDALLVFGGSTLHRICTTLRIEVVMACEELLPGVPLSRVGNLTLITKAGGFGGADLVGAIRRIVEGRS